MNKHFIQLLLIAILLTACGPVTLPPPPTVTATQTITPYQTPTSRPTQTAIPAATPHPTLQTEGPYLLYTDGYNVLTTIDANGIGRKQMGLPTGGYFSWYFENTVSPDGKWVAYYKGSEREPYDLALHLFNLSNGTSQLISNLIAPGFPENLEPVTKTLYFGEYDAECESDPKCRLTRVESAFREGIRHSIDWSPDSKFLAFAAQIDGPSSDVYIFSTEDNSIQRLTDELENIWSIDWSPNGERILYEHSVMGDTYLSRFIRIADPKIKSLQHPEAIDGGAFWFSYGWINQNSYLIYNGGEGAPPNRLRIINIETQEIKEIWEYSAESFFVDKENQIIVLVPYGTIWLDEKPEPGIYVVSFNGEFRKISDRIVRIIDGQDATKHYIAAINDYKELVSIKLDGSITSLQRKPDHYVAPRSSPNGKWIIITNETETELYSEDLQVIKSLEIHATEIIWRPDSAGVFLYSKPKLFYLSTNNETPKLIEICALEDCEPYKYVWLQ